MSKMNKTPARAEALGRIWTRLTWPARQLAMLLVVAYRGARRLLVTPKSEAELRADDKARQSKARRELRGLSPVHNPRTAGPIGWGPQVEPRSGMAGR